jgi:hypothetical protein
MYAGGRRWARGTMERRKLLLDWKGDLMPLPGAKRRS